MTVTIETWLPISSLIASLPVSSNTDRVAMKRNIARRINRVIAEKGPGDWVQITGTGKGKRIRICPERMRRAHPEFFSERPPTREEYDAQQEQIRELVRTIARLTTQMDSFWTAAHKWFAAIATKFH